MKTVEELKRGCPYTSEEISAKGDKVYEQLRADLERKDWGKFLIIEIESGDYLVGEDELELILQAKKKYPSKFFTMRRIGYRATHWARSKS